MIPKIRNDIISLLVNNNTIRVRELPITFTFRPKNTNKGPLLIKDLNAVVVGVSYDDLVVPLVDCDATRFIKLAIFISL